MFVSSIMNHTHNFCLIFLYSRARNGSYVFLQTQKVEQIFDQVGQEFDYNESQHIQFQAEK